MYHNYDKLPKLQAKTLPIRIEIVLKTVRVFYFNISPIYHLGLAQQGDDIENDYVRLHSG